MSDKFEYKKWNSKMQRELKDFRCIFFYILCKNVEKRQKTTK